MTDKTGAVAQQIHDLFTEAAAEVAAGLKGQVPPEEITRALMMGAASFTAATWVASAKASGIDLPTTKRTMFSAIDNFWPQAIVPQLVGGTAGTG